MNSKSKKKFMKTRYAQKIMKDQKMYKSIPSQRFTVAKGVRLRTWQLPVYDDTQTFSPQLNESKETKKAYLEKIKIEKIEAIHKRINERGPLREGV